MSNISYRKECLFDLGDCCLKYPVSSSSAGYHLGPNFECFEDSSEYSANSRVVGPLNPRYKYYDRVNAHSGNPTLVGIECQDNYITGTSKFTDREFK